MLVCAFPQSSFIVLGLKEMATHSSILACRILWTEEPGEAIVHEVIKSQTRLTNT